MQKIDITGLSPNQAEYVESLEKTVESQQVRINQLMDMLAKMQKLCMDVPVKRVAMSSVKKVTRFLCLMKQKLKQAINQRSLLFKPLYHHIPENQSEPKRNWQKQCLLLKLSVILMKTNAHVIFVMLN